MLEKIKFSRVSCGVARFAKNALRIRHENKPCICQVFD